MRTGATADWRELWNVGQMTAAIVHRPDESPCHALIKAEISCLQSRDGCWPAAIQFWCEYDPIGGLTKLRDSESGTVLADWDYGDTTAGAGAYAVDD